MNHYVYKLAQLSLLLLCFMAMFGCADSESDVEDQWLVRVGNRSVSLLEFNEAFEIAKTSYAHQIRNKPDDLRKAQKRLLSQMTIELIVLERAQELGIELPQAEVERKVAEIKSDYPEGAFEETLLEVAVSYETWVRQLKTRWLMEKVIDKELDDKIVITSEDVASYYEANFKGHQQASDLNQNSGNINEAIIKILRRAKKEEAIGPWINDLKSKYEIEINNAQWENISGAQEISKNDLKLDDAQNQLE